MMAARNRNKSLVFQIKQQLDLKLKIGESKRAAKENHTAHEGIYSWETYRSYLRHCIYFAKFCEQKHGCKTWTECRPYVDEWLQHRIDQKLSPYTIKLEASALAKLYGCRTTEFINTPPRLRSNITRSRGSALRDVRFSEKRNADLVNFCRSTGLRRAELRALTGDKLVKRDGRYYIHVCSGSKGGKERYAPVIGDVDLVVRLMKEAGSAKVFPLVNAGADIHGYRAEYAVRIYNSLARGIEDMERRDIYFCRGDMRGLWLDRQAMLEASRALGHNRIDVVAEHYLWLNHHDEGVNTK